MKNQAKVIASALALVGFQAAHANIVLNPGFELGPPLGTSAPDWTFTSATSGSDFNYTHGPAHTGSYEASFGAITSGSSLSTLDTISQSLATVAGHEYQISYWLDTGGGDARGAGYVQFISSFGSDTLQNLNPPAITAGYTEYTFDAEATANSTTLSFSGKSVEGWIELDDVSAVDLGPAAVPEPTTIIAGASMLLPFGAGALRMLRKKLQAA